MGAIPELVENILGHVFENFTRPDLWTYELWTDWTENCDRTMFACTLVNSLWNAEANRYLWQVCGSRWGPKIPWFPRLLSLVTKVSPERQQVLATYIKSLRIGDERGLKGELPSEDGDERWGYDHFDERTYLRSIGKTGSMGTLWASRWLRLLAHMQFPRLEELTLESSGAADDNFETQNMRPYLQPKLRSLHIGSHVFTADNLGFQTELYTSLTQHCRGLQKLDIDLGDYYWHKNSVDDTFKLLFNGLRIMPSLTDFALKIGSQVRIEPCALSELIGVVALHPSLRHIAHLPRINDECITNLSENRDLMTYRLFPQLEELFVTFEEKGLEYFLPHLVNLRDLQVYVAHGNRTPHHEILSCFRPFRFPHLKTLKLWHTFLGTIIGSDFISLARKEYRINWRLRSTFL